MQADRKIIIWQAARISALGSDMSAIGKALETAGLALYWTGSHEAMIQVRADGGERAKKVLFNEPAGASAANDARMARINELAVSLRDGIGTGPHVASLRTLVQQIVDASR